MIRLTACLGVPLDVIEPCGFPLGAAAIRRAALDYGGLGEVVRHSGWTAFRASPGGRLVLFTTRGATPLPAFSFRPDDVLLFGRESAGVPDEVHDAAGSRVVIPLVAGARSLNVATAAAIALGEALRQTNGFPTPALRD